MAIRERRVKGVARAGKIELEAIDFIPDGTIVDVVMPAELEKSNLGASGSTLLASLREGFYLGGGPYLNRDEFYGETGRPK
ncbi:MAG: hypothetical protein P4L46_07740 [Fimbriimonas sp.]|nr:hypothetical protein [Fimbriimonas sp.]